MSWAKKAELEPNVRVALEGFVKRCEEARRRLRRSTGPSCSPIRVRSARASPAPTSRARDVERLVAWVQRQLAKPQAAARRRGGQADPRLRGRAGRARRGRSGGPLRRRGRSDPAAPRPAQARRPDRRRRRRAHLRARRDRRGAGPLARSRSRCSSRRSARRTTIRRKRSVTIAGDTAQRLVFDNNFTGWDELLAQISGQPARSCGRSSCLSLDRRGHAARARDPRARARARRAARGAPRRAGRAPRVRRSRRGGRVPRRRAAQADGARADRVAAR